MPTQKQGPVYYIIKLKAFTLGLPNTSHERLYSEKANMYYIIVVLVTPSRLSAKDPRG